MKYVTAALSVLVALSAHAASAYWTGNMRFVQTVTYQSGISCEYQYANRRFWVAFVSTSCPPSVEVQ